MNGTRYNEKTLGIVVTKLESARQDRTRIIIQYGDETGNSWGDHYDISGYVGRSSGKTKKPILLHNNRSNYGGAILDSRIIGIWKSKGKYPLWVHPNFKAHPDGPKWCHEFTKE